MIEYYFCLTSYVKVVRLSNDGIPHINIHTKFCSVLNIGSEYTGVPYILSYLLSYFHTDDPSH